MTCAAAAAGLNVDLNKGVQASTSLSTKIMTLNSQKDEQMCHLVGEGGGYQQMENASSGSLVISEEDSCMLACLQQLQHLVPTVPPNTQLSQVQLLQHVIDYILDLELTLDYESLRPLSCNKQIVGIETVCERQQPLVWDPLEQVGCVEHLNEHGQVSREEMSGQNQTRETEEQCSTELCNKTFDSAYNSPSVVIIDNSRSNV